MLKVRDNVASPYTPYNLIYRVDNFKPTRMIYQKVSGFRKIMITKFDGVKGAQVGDFELDLACHFEGYLKIS